MDAILGKLKLVEDGTQKATRLHESVAELDAQISRVSARVPFVEKLEGAPQQPERAQRATSISKLEEQLARRAELDDAQERSATAWRRRWSTRSTSSTRSARCRPAWCRWSPRSNTLKSEIERRGEAARRHQVQTRRRSSSRRSATSSSSRPARRSTTEVAERTRQMQALVARSWRARRRSRTSCSPSWIASRAGSATRPGRSRRPRIS